MDTGISKAEKNKFITGVWTDYYTVDKLPVFLYHKTGTALEKAIKKGFKKNVGRQVAYTNVDRLAMKEITSNTWIFSAAKTYAQTHTLIESRVKLKKLSTLFDDSGKRILPYKAFKEGYYTQSGNHVDGALSIFETFNDTYLRSEYNTVITMAESAAHWNRISEDSDTFPNLQYSAVEDGVICEICNALDGTIAPIGDSFWDINYPPQHYNNCRCTVIQLGSDAKISDNLDSASEAADKAGRIEMFKNNVGKSHVIFKSDGPGQHPYFKIAPKESIKNNFNLPNYAD